MIIGHYCYIFDISKDPVPVEKKPFGFVNLTRKTEHQQFEEELQTFLDKNKCKNTED